MGNFLLVTGPAAPRAIRKAWRPAWCAPSRSGLAHLSGTCPNPKPGELADAESGGAWDIGLIGAEPQRAEKIAFTAAFAEIEATYLVPPNSAITSLAEVDRPGVQIAFTARAAYDLWLDRNIRHATLVRSDSLDGACRIFADDGPEVLTGLRPRLLADAETLPGSRILPGGFTAVQQAIGTTRGNAAGAAFLRDFLEEAKASGLVARLIEQHQVRGLSVASAA